MKVTKVRLTAVVVVGAADLAACGLLAACDQRQVPGAAPFLDQCPIPVTQHDSSFPTCSGMRTFGVIDEEYMAYGWTLKKPANRPRTESQRQLVLKMGCF